jgi:hypothetical protein
MSPGGAVLQPSGPPDLKENHRGEPDMPKLSLLTANNSAAARHLLQGTNLALFTGRAQILANVASRLHGIDNRNTQSVTAVAYDTAYPTIVLVARNGQLTDSTANPISTRLDRAVHAAGVDWGDILANDIFDWQVHNVNHTFGETEGWHAEMIIVRFLLLAGRTKGSFGTLSIGASSICCADCSGWMTRYGIPHAPLGIPGTAPTMPWRNPSTASTFAYTQGQVTYYKAPGSDSLGVN